MTPIFLGGSRAVSKLNSVIREQLINLMNHRCTILIGDANGADKAMQRFFADHHYTSVVVFCMNEFRNNLGSWQTRVIRADRKTRGFSYFTIKDKEMSREAKCGLMLWDGASKGTLRNIFELVHDHKRVLVYLAPEKKFYKLTSEEELADLLSHCDAAVIQNLTRELGPELQLDLRPAQMPSPLTGR
jgi:hypothetical protein